MSRSKQKGTAFENEVRDALEQVTLRLEGYCTLPVRVSRSGAIVGHPGDVRLECASHWRPEPERTGCNYPVYDHVYHIECKRRASAWAELYRWLDGTPWRTVLGDKKPKRPPNDFLALRADRQRTLIVMDLEQFKSLLAGDLPLPRRQ